MNSIIIRRSIVAVLIFTRGNWLSSIKIFQISPHTRDLYEMMGHRIEYTESQRRAMGIYVDHENDPLWRLIEEGLTEEQSVINTAKFNIKNR